MRKFILGRRVHRVYFFGALTISPLLWFGFKQLYPYPNVIFDSYNYVKAAALNWSFNSWPIGYSKALQIFALFSHSANLLVFLQYMWVE